MMDAEKWKDTILAKSREYVEIGVSVASDLTEKGRTRARSLSNQARISKAQRQLGALVYSLDPVQEEPEASSAGAPVGTDADAAGKKYCPQCGAEVAPDALFCTKCGAQL